ncbi:MAG TPA: hypothetical protein VH306_00845 [Gaiellaceae bacterium]
MIEVGERVSDAEVWLSPNEPVRLADVWQDGELALFVFYLFDWSST